MFDFEAFTDISKTSTLTQAFAPGFLAVEDELDDPLLLLCDTLPLLDDGVALLLCDPLLLVYDGAALLCCDHLPW